MGLKHWIQPYYQLKTHFFLQFLGGGTPLNLNFGLKGRSNFKSSMQKPSNECPMTHIMQNLFHEAQIIFFFYTRGGVRCLAFWHAKKVVAFSTKRMHSPTQLKIQIFLWKPSLIHCVYRKYAFIDWSTDDFVHSRCPFTYQLKMYPSTINTCLKMTLSLAAGEGPPISVRVKNHIDPKRNKPLKMETIPKLMTTSNKDNPKIKTSQKMKMTQKMRRCFLPHPPIWQSELSSIFFYLYPSKWRPLLDNTNSICNLFTQSEDLCAVPVYLRCYLNLASKWSKKIDRMLSFSKVQQECSLSFSHTAVVYVASRNFYLGINLPRSYQKK